MNSALAPASEPALIGWGLSERLGQPGLPENGVRGVTARDTDWHGEAAGRDWAAPDLVTALALPDQRAAGRAQEIAQPNIELRGHSSGERLGFAQRGKLKKDRSRFDAGVIVRKEIEGHGGHLRQEAVERRGVRCGRYVVAIPAPDACFGVPDRRDGEDQGSRHFRLARSARGRGLARWTEPITSQASRRSLTPGNGAAGPPARVQALSWSRVPAPFSAWPG